MITFVEIISNRNVISTIKNHSFIDVLTLLVYQLSAFLISPDDEVPFGRDVSEGKFVTRVLTFVEA